MAIKIIEVGPRDGLQNDAVTLSVDDRISFVNQLAATGVHGVEAVSFVHPQRVPQMAHAEEVCAGISAPEPVTLSGLVLNERGMQRFLQTSLPEARIAFCVTDTFNHRNQGTTVADSLAQAERMIHQGHEHGRRVTVTLAASFGCPFEGEVPTAVPLRLAARLIEANVDEVWFADTIGVGVPRQVRELVGGLGAGGVPIGLHLHNTRNTGYANAMAGLAAGVTGFDAAAGGIGGCPFAPNATGNIATEDLVNLLEREGVSTGVDLPALLGVVEWLTHVLERPVPGQLSRAGIFPDVAARNAAASANASKE